MSKLLFVDDDTELLNTNQKYFIKEGYEVLTAANAKSCIRQVTLHKPDCIILDIMMPEINGFTTFEYLKKLCAAPIIFLSAKDSEEDKIKGLLLGADDYMSKPYSLRELSARIKVQIRRTKIKTLNEAAISYPPLTLNLLTHKAFFHEEEILLSNREYELLYLLVSKPNQAITYEQIANAMWGSYSNDDRRAIMVTASRLRKKLESYEGMPEFIETIWSKGYLFRTKNGGQTYEQF